MTQEERPRHQDSLARLVVCHGVALVAASFPCLTFRSTSNANRFWGGLASQLARMLQKT